MGVGIAGVKPLLLSAQYVPVPTAMLGQRGRYGVCACGESFRHMGERGRIPKLGPCCQGKKEPQPPRPVATPKQPRAPRRTHQHYTADDVLRRITSPGNALVAFEGGVTLFVGATHFQADTVYAALRAADAAQEAA